MQPKLYLAGPEVFLPNASENADMQRQICQNYDFIALHPMDNNIDLGERDIKTAIRIYNGDISQIKECDIVVANCNSFRGVCIDDGTAYELGYSNALNKPSYGYIKEIIPLATRTVRDLQCRHFLDEGYIDGDGYLVTDDFGTSVNLMMQCGIQHFGDTLVEGDFEDCLKKLRTDIDTGKLLL